MVALTAGAALAGNDMLNAVSGEATATYDEIYYGDGYDTVDAGGYDYAAEDCQRVNRIRQLIVRRTRGASLRGRGPY